MRILNLFLSAIAITLFSLSNTFGQNPEFKSGNLNIDTDLKSIDVEATADFGRFKAEMGASYNISEKIIDELHASVKMSPAEIYLALEIGHLTHKPIDEVVKVYKVNRNQGWGVIAKELGIKPGSKEFHALKAKTKANAEKGKGSKKPKENKGNGNGRKAKN